MPEHGRIIGRSLRRTHQDLRDFVSVRLPSFRELLVVLPMFRLRQRREPRLILSLGRTWGAGPGAGAPDEFAGFYAPAFPLNRQNGKTKT
jgi:hypothetical protein